MRVYYIEIKQLIKVSGCEREFSSQLQISGSSPLNVFKMCFVVFKMSLALKTSSLDSIFLHVLRKSLN